MPESKAFALFGNVLLLNHESSCVHHIADEFEYVRALCAVFVCLFPNQAARAELNNVPGIRLLQPGSCSNSESISGFDPFRLVVDVSGLCNMTGYEAADWIEQHHHIIPEMATTQVSAMVAPISCAGTCHVYRWIWTTIFISMACTLHAHIKQKPQLHVSAVHKWCCAAVGCVGSGPRQ